MTPTNTEYFYGNFDLRADTKSSGTHRFDTVSLLTLYVFLLLAIPSALVFAPLGGAGGPATLLALALMVWYLTLRLHPASGLYRGSQPIRVAGVLFLCAVLVSYVSANRNLLPSLQQNGADRGIISVVGWLAVLVIAADGIDSMDRLEILLRGLLWAWQLWLSLGLSSSLLDSI